ncbi:hypothetical protein RB595_007446 [Gaeumannomyces hyphopodioides]
MSRLLAALAACLALFPHDTIQSPASPLAPLGQRQEDGLVSSSTFLRRAYHKSEILDGWLYIDGGEFSYRTSTGIKYQYSTSLLAIDLSQDFTGASVKMISTPKPLGAPSLRQGGLWVDRTQKALYLGFAGSHSAFPDRADSPRGLWSFTPDSKGSGNFSNLNGTGPAWFLENPRPFDGLYASGAGAGYFFGGFEGDKPDIEGVNVADEIPTSGMLTYDFKAKTLTKSGAKGLSIGGEMQRGNMIYVPNFGREGILVSIGGCQRSKKIKNFDFLVDNTVARVYDIATKSWHEQITTGGEPTPRKDYCIAGAASNNRTFEILMYAGWGGNLGTSAIAFDQAYILSLPSFRWFKAEYKALRPRHGVSCHHAGGGQVITVGGADTTQEGPNNLYQDVFNNQDSFNQGIGIFDLSTLKFADSYKGGGLDSYTLSPEIQSWYNLNSRLPTFDSAAVSDVFAVENFTAQSVSKPPADAASGGSGSGGGSGGGDGSSRTAAIVGGVMGGVALTALAAGLAWFFLRRRRRRREALAGVVVQSLSVGPNTKNVGGVYHEVSQDHAAQPAEYYYPGYDTTRESTPVAFYDPGAAARTAPPPPAVVATAAAAVAREPTPSLASEPTRYELHSTVPSELASVSSGGVQGSPHLQQHQQSQVHEIQGFQDGRAPSKDEDNYKYNIRF